MAKTLHHLINFTCLVVGNTLKVEMEVVKSILERLKTNPSESLESLHWLKSMVRVEQVGDLSLRINSKFVTCRQLSTANHYQGLSYKLKPGEGAIWTYVALRKKQE
jgi:hypothetical protein